MGNNLIDSIVEVMGGCRAPSLTFIESLIHALAKAILLIIQKALACLISVEIIIYKQRVFTSI